MKFPWHVKPQQEKLDELIQSEAYKSSHYKIQKINKEYYALQYGNTGNYVDLVSPGHQWNKHDKFFNDCFGSIPQVIRAFEYVQPNINNIKITSVETF